MEVRPVFYTCVEWLRYQEMAETVLHWLVHFAAKVGDPVVTKEQVEAALQEMKDEELAGIKASVAGTTKLPAELSAQTNKKTPEPYTVATRGGKKGQLQYYPTKSDQP